MTYDNLETKLNQISAMKSSFINGEIDGQTLMASNIAAHITESWIRCAQSGLLPTSTPGSDIDIATRPARRRTKLSDSERFAVATVKPLFHTVCGQFSQEMAIFLISNNGRILFSTGSEQLRSLFNSNLNINELHHGAISATIAMRTGLSCTLVGPENYLQAFSATANTTSPVVTDRENVIGYCMMMASLPANPAETTAKCMATTTALLATLISSRLMQHAEEEQKEFLRSVCAGLLAYSKQPLIVADSSGVILDISPHAREFIIPHHQSAEIASLFDVFGHSTNLVQSFLKGNSINNTRAELLTNPSHKQIVASSRPVTTLGQGRRLAGGIIELSYPIEDNPHFYLDESFDNPHVFGHTLQSIIGDDPAIIAARERARFLASTQATILLSGDTGTGKDLFAQAIHNESRPNSPFIVVNCASISSQDLHSILYGYREHDAHVSGSLEAAQGGTLYLDFIADLPLKSQGVLLRALDNRDIRTNDSTQSWERGFRIICSSRIDLLSLVERGDFRSDLYYRISTAQIDLPPLKERQGDAALLVNLFIRRYCEMSHVPPIVCSDEAMDALMAYSWPGNIRQLKSRIWLACDICEKGVIEYGDLHKEILREVSGGESPSIPVQSIRDLEYTQIVNALNETSFNVSQAAMKLGIGRSTLYEKIAKYKIARK